MNANQVIQLVQRVTGKKVSSRKNAESKLIDFLFKSEVDPNQYIDKVQVIAETSQDNERLNESGYVQYEQIWKVEGSCILVTISDDLPSFGLIFNYDPELIELLCEIYKLA